MAPAAVVVAALRVLEVLEPVVGDFPAVALLVLTVAVFLLKTVERALLSLSTVQPC